MPKLVDIAGEQFGLLTVLRKVKFEGKNHTSYWKVKCTCGSFTVVTYEYLRAGKRDHKSCGCSINSFIAKSKREQWASMSAKSKSKINAKRSASLQQFWLDNPDARALKSQSTLTSFEKNDTRLKLSRISIENWQDAKVRAKRIKGLRASAKTHHCKTPEGRKQASERRLKVLEDPRHSEIASAAQRASYANRPERRARLIKTSNTIENRAKASLRCLTQRGRKSGPEIKLEEAVSRKWFVYVGDNTRLKDQPISADFVVAHLKLLIQVDGCFWHCCKHHGKEPKGEHAKAKRTKDRSLTKYAESKGWTVLRFWEHEINDDIESVVKRIKKVRRNLKDG